MKKNLVISVFICYSVIAMSQVTPEAFLGEIPALPANVCDGKLSDKTEYLTRVSDLSDKLKLEISRRKNETEENVKQNEGQMKANMAKKSGLSDAEIARLENGKELTETEKDAMVDRMLQQNHNMSMGDIKDMKSMSEEEKKAWAGKYAAGQMADARGNPDQVKAGQEQAGKTYQLASEQKMLLDKISAREENILKQYTELDHKASVLKVKLDQDINPLQKELSQINDGEGSTQADVEHAQRVLNQIHSFQVRYCEDITPQYHDVLNRNLISVKSALPDYYRLEEITAELTRIQTGVDAEMFRPGLMAMQAVHEYVKKLNEVYKFVLYEDSGN